MVSIVDEIKPLLTKHAELKQCVVDIERNKKETIDTYMKMCMPYDLYRSTMDNHLRRMNRLAEEIKDRTENPQAYPIGGGCGTIDDSRRDIAEKYLEMEELKTGQMLILDSIQKQQTEFDYAINEAQEDEHQFLYTIGLNALKEKRKQIGKKMSLTNRMQQEAYEFQKERYESCKKNGVFSKKDREFIEFHKEQNIFYKEEWLKLADARDNICELINVLDPEDIDDGYDEFEDNE